MVGVKPLYLSQGGLVGRKKIGKFVLCLSKYYIIKFE